MKMLLLLLFPFMLLADEIADIDARILIIDARVALIPSEISPIQSDIDTLSTQLIEPQDQAQALQLQIDALAEQRDALPVDDAGRIPLQGQINSLIAEQAPLLATIQDLTDQKTVKEAEKKVLVDEQNSLTNEKVSLLKRKQVLQYEARFAAIPDLRLAMDLSGLNQPNAKLLRKEIIDNADEVKLAALEAVVPQVNDALQERQILELTRKRFECVDKVKKTMFVLNYKKNLDKQQVKTFVKSTKDISDLIESGALETALDEIAAIPSDGTVILESDKVKLIEVIDSCK